jgi:hypothetical protein
MAAAGLVLLPFNAAVGQALVLSISTDVAKENLPLRIDQCAYDQIKAKRDAKPGGAFESWVYTASSPSGNKTDIVGVQIEVINKTGQPSLYSYMRRTGGNVTISIHADADVKYEFPFWTGPGAGNFIAKGSEDVMKEVLALAHAVVSCPEKQSPGAGLFPNERRYTWGLPTYGPS